LVRKISISKERGLEDFVSMKKKEKEIVFFTDFLVQDSNSPTCGGGCLSI
jgi:hypothetical protein